MATIEVRGTRFYYEQGRGHTRTPMGDAGESVETHAEDAAALIAALGLVRPVIVGSSGGARIATEVARVHPGGLPAIRALRWTPSSP